MVDDVVHDAAKTLRDHKDARKRLSNAIGVFCIEFAFLEKYINWGIEVLLPLHSKKKADLLLGPIRSVDTRLDILESLVNGIKMDLAIRVELLSFIKSCRELNTYRNWLLHGQWSGWHPMDDSWTKFGTETKKKFKYKWKSFNAKEIEVEAAKCIPLVVNFMKAMKLHSP